ncbi:uncharacterized protein LOC126662041 [Mercurialis annua]|uniref:uncharacterized protein LOC126662041 n=1 Tax=Mercurialis annua TaxID=3986 RepID=UPI00215EDFA1|nr:uncharacterized protein LOC126662041 [Mercurialis annua]
MKRKTSNSNVKLKLLIDKKSKKVLFAEANKDFVDFLFSLMSLPLGNVIKLLTKKKMVGCLANLYGSIETLNDTFLQAPDIKESILNPRSPSHAIQTPLLLTNTDHFSASQSVYFCPHGCRYRAALDPEALCPTCNRKMSTGGNFVAPTPDGAELVVSGAGGGGFVKDVVTYMVMDDLEVKPMSTISSITLINTFDIRDLRSLQEKVVDIGLDEGLKLLQVSLQAKNVLTSVFLKA